MSKELMLDRVIPILLLISKSKLVPDFALTLHFVHLIITSLYSGSLPTNLLWWLLQLGSAFLMVSLGVWACRYREMQPITFGLGTKAQTANGSAVPGRSGGNGRTGDEHVRGGRGGRREGGGPSYEMVPIKEDEVVGDENV
jgi:protein SYS1